MVLCLADWVLIEDFGFFGGLGTDPNSMIPFALLAVSGYLALTPATGARPAEPATDQPRNIGGGRGGTGSGQLPCGAAWRTASFRHGRLGRRARADHPGSGPDGRRPGQPNADPILAESIAGSSAPLNFPAKPFRLTDQYGRTVSLASLRGKVVLLTFLDPVCTTDCPLIAQEFRAAGQLLGAASEQVELVAIVTNPVYHQVADTQAFDRAEQLNQVPNWLYLTGSVPQLQQVWKAYGVSAEILPGGSMIGHQDVAYVIDRMGHVRQELNTDPGPGTTATKSSFAVLLANAARQTLRSS